MSRLPLLPFAGLALPLLLAGAPVRADGPMAAAPAEAAVTPAEAPAADRPVAGGEAEPPLLVDTTARREPSPPSRPGKRWSTRAELDSNSYRVSLSRGKLDLGVGFDAPAGAATRTARSVDPAGPIVPTLPSLSIGLRSVAAGPPPNSLIERASTDGANPASGQRVGLEWKPAPSNVFVPGGLRLTGDDRVTMKVRSGQIGLYMKSSF